MENEHQFYTEVVIPSCKSYSAVIMVFSSLFLLVVMSLSYVLGSYGQEPYHGFNLGMFGVRGYYFTLGVCVLCTLNTQNKNICYKKCECIFPETENIHNTACHFTFKKFNCSKFPFESTIRKKTVYATIFLPVRYKIFSRYILQFLCFVLNFLFGK